MIGKFFVTTAVFFIISLILFVVLLAIIIYGISKENKTKDKFVAKDSSDSRTLNGPEKVNGRKNQNFENKIYENIIPITTVQNKKYIGFNDLEYKKMCENHKKFQEKYKKRAKTIDKNKTVIEQKNLSTDAKANENEKSFNYFKKKYERYFEQKDCSTALQNFIINVSIYFKLDLRKNRESYDSSFNYNLFCKILNIILINLKNGGIIIENENYNNELIKIFSKVKLDKNNLIIETHHNDIYNIFIKENEYNVHHEYFIAELYVSVMKFVENNLIREYDPAKTKNTDQLSNFAKKLNGNCKIIKSEKNITNSEKEDQNLFFFKYKFYTLFPKNIDVFSNMIDAFDGSTYKLEDLEIIEYPELLFLSIKIKSKFKDTDFLNEYSKILLPKNMEKNENFEIPTTSFVLKNIICKLKIEERVFIFNFLKLDNFWYEINQRFGIKKIDEIIIDEIIQKTRCDILLFYRLEDLIQN
ncbi:hypothetical protein GVAV_001664 [Gurleya vavrai]